MTLSQEDTVPVDLAYGSRLNHRVAQMFVFWGVSQVLFKSQPVKSSLPHIIILFIQDSIDESKSVEYSIQNVFLFCFSLLLWSIVSLFLFIHS